MNDYFSQYISRKDVCIQLEKQESIDGQPRAIRRARRIVAEFPAADVMERKSAWWKGAGLGDYYCSLCNEVYSIGEERVKDWHFCPACGAVMDGGQDYV